MAFQIGYILSKHSWLGEFAKETYKTHIYTGYGSRYNVQGEEGGKEIFDESLIDSLNS